MTEDINNHLADIVSDVSRVRGVVNNDENPPRITEEIIKLRLSDISNALDDLYNDIIGI